MGKLYFTITKIYRGRKKKNADVGTGSYINCISLSHVKHAIHALSISYYSQMSKSIPKELQESSALPKNSFGF